MAETLTPEQKSEMLQYLQENGTDFDNVFTNPQKADWSHVVVPIIDMRDPLNVKAFSLDLKSVLDVYGIDVEKLSIQVAGDVATVASDKGIVEGAKGEVLQAEGRINEAETRINKAEGRVNALETDYTTYRDEAAGSANSASNSEGVAVNAKDLAVGAQTASEDTLKAIQALAQQVQEISGKVSAPTILIGSTLYTVSTEVHLGRIFTRYSKVVAAPAQ